jgi:hypothetical protein
VIIVFITWRKCGTNKEHAEATMVDDTNLPTPIDAGRRQVPTLKDKGRSRIVTEHDQALPCARV